MKKDWRIRSNHFWHEWVMPNFVLIIYCLLLVLITWSFSYGFVWQDRRETMNGIVTSNNLLTHAFEEHVRRNLQQIDESLQLIKFEYEREQRVTPFITRYYAKLYTNPMLNHSIMIDENRQVIASSIPVNPNTKFDNVPHIDYHESIDRWELYFGRQFVGRISGVTSIHLSRRLNHMDGSFAGVVVAAIDPLFFTRFYQDMELPPETIVRVVGQDGWMRASRDPDEPKSYPNLKQAGLLFKLLDQNKSGNYTSIGAVTGKIRFFSYRTMPDYPLIVQVGVDSETALAPHHNRRNMAYGLAAFITILLIAFTVGIAVLTRQRHLSEQRHQLLFSSMSAGAVYYGNDCRLLDCNEAATRILGLPRAQCQARSLLDPEWQCVQEDGKTLPNESFPAVVSLRTGKAVEQQVLGIYNPKAEGTVWLSTTAIPQFRIGDAKPYQVFLLFNDITERVRQERSLIQDARLANRIQHALLPQAAKSEHFDLRTLYHPYRYISGDLYYMDWRQENQVLRCYLIDVTGHGLATALHTSAINVLLHEVNDLDLPLADQLNWLNRQTARYFEDAAFAAALIFEIDLTMHQLRYACAGIPEFWLSSAYHSGPQQAKGMFLGIDAKETYESHSIALAPGDCLYFMTDGLTDLLRQRSDPPLADFNAMLANLTALSESAECRDDATALCVKIRSLPRDQEQLNGWPRFLNINGYSDYRRRRETLSKWLAELTGNAHSIQEVAINEAIANALECRDNIPRPHQARVKLNRVGQVMIVRIKTNRIGFAGNALLRRLKAAPELLFSYGQLESMGRGIPLMVSLSDRITYNSEGTELLMAWRLERS
jgi:PAS domain-containing protein/anti-sigma regulatory factor (Ser/Thr protein kinase)